MKNIHVLPTDKPSQLYHYIERVDKLFLDLKRERTPVSTVQHQNIYITSDEDIKENDYIITQDGRLVQVSYLLAKDVQGGHKVILTTNKLLIADGVQAIDDEFLEWFVNNSSCESVEVKKDYLAGYYVIPKEAPKPMHEQIIEHCGGEEKFKEIAGLKPKQETLEEAAERLAKHFNIDFIAGAKWQKEQDKNKVSEEEVINILVEFSAELKNVWNITEWFEQFKKK